MDYSNKWSSKCKNNYEQIILYNQNSLNIWFNYEIFDSLIIFIKSAKISMDNQIEPDINDIIKALPVKQKVPVVALKKILDEREKIDQQQQKKVTQTKLKYQKLIQPLLQRASEIIRGASIKSEEVAGAQPLMKPGQNVNDFLKGKIIDDYWIGVFSNSALVDQINQKDQQALKNLLDIQKIDDPDDVESIELKFIFRPNSFFNETQVRRRLDVKKGEALCLEGDVLTWKQNQCLTHTLKRVTNKKTGQKTTILGQKVKSFFDIFINYDKKDQQMLDRVSSNMIQISNLLILDSVDYFLGVINADEQSQDDLSDQNEESEENDNQK